MASVVLQGFTSTRPAGLTFANLDAEPGNEAVFALMDSVEARKYVAGASGWQPSANDANPMFATVPGPRSITIDQVEPGSGLEVLVSYGPYVKAYVLPLFSPYDLHMLPTSETIVQLASGQFAGGPSAEAVVALTSGLQFINFENDQRQELIGQRTILAVAVGDVVGDARDDIVYAEQGPLGANVLGILVGAVGDPVSGPTMPVINLRASLEVTQIDGVGKDDLVYAHGSTAADSELVIVVGDSMQEIPFPINVVPITIHADVDYNGDAVPDIVVTGMDGTILVFPSNP